MPRAGGQVAVAEHGPDLTEADLTAAEVTAAEVTVAEDHVPRPPRPGMPPGTLAAPAGPAPRPATPATLPSIPPPPAPGTVPVPEAGHPSGARTRVAGPGTESGELPAAGSATPGPTAAAQPDVPAVPAAPTAPVVPDEPPRPASTPPAQPRALVRGQAVTIAALGPFRGTLRIEAAWSGPQTADADVIVLVLDDNRRVGGDGDLVFYNQPVHPSEAVRLAGKLREGDRGADSVDIDTSLLPGGRSRVLVALALDTAAGAHTFADVPATVAVVDPVTRRRLAEFRLSGGPETVMILTEVYSRNDEWRLRAVGQGYAEGLAALVTEHGVVVEGE
jgi:stress response protein SCP2